MKRVIMLFTAFGIAEILSTSTVLAGDDAGSRPGLNFIVGGIGATLDARGSGSPRNLAPQPDGIMDHGPVATIREEPTYTGAAAGSGQYRQPTTSVDGVTPSHYPQTLIGDAQLANYGKDTATPYKGVSPAPYTDTTNAPTGSGGPVNGGVSYGGDVLQPVAGGGSNGGGSLPPGSGGGSLPYGSGASAGGVPYGGDVLQPVAVYPNY